MSNLTTNHKPLHTRKMEKRWSVAIVKSHIIINVKEYIYIYIYIIHMYIPDGGCIHMMSSLLGIHCSDGREHVATVSPRSVSQE